MEYSNLNYKDAMVAAGAYPGLPLPMVGGIDLVGRVLESGGSFAAGDEVIVSGFGVGTDHFGGFAEEASLKDEWAFKVTKVRRI